MNSSEVEPAHGTAYPQAILIYKIFKTLIFVSYGSYRLMFDSSKKYDNSTTRLSILNQINLRNYDNTVIGNGNYLNHIVKLKI